MLNHEIVLAEKYRHLRARERRGKTVLSGLSARTEREGRLIRQILSSYHCRLCGDCCRGFSISSDEQNFREIFWRIEKEATRFSVKVRQEQAGGGRIFRVDPSFSSRCGFFERAYDYGLVPKEILEAAGESVEEGAPFGCGVYDVQPHVCSMFPVGAGIAENPGSGEQIADDALHLTAECKPIMELFCAGIGHMLLREIAVFGKGKPGEWENFGKTLMRSMVSANGFLLAPQFQPVSESGEPVFLIKRAGMPPSSSG
ncbi:MAG: hypothetical protein QXH30_03875 [Candidatus Bilamarchaeaceae archaeon]